MKPNDHYIVTMWIKGTNSAAMAAELGIARGNLVRRAHRLGLPHRESGARDRNLWPSIVGWLRNGWSPEQIADGIGITGRARELMLEDSD